MWRGAKLPHSESTHTTRLFVCCGLGSAQELLSPSFYFAGETMLSKNNLDGDWPQSPLLTAQQLFESCWSQLAGGFDLSGFYLMRILTDSELQNGLPSKIGNFTRSSNDSKTIFSMVSYKKALCLLIKLRRETYQVKYQKN